jgi:lipoprotein-releasing system ATP-binding protein
MSDALNVTDLHKEYPTPTEPLKVLRGVSLELAAGDSLVIVGPSGSGKSTLLNIIGTLDEPTAGSVRLGQTNPFDLAPGDLAKFAASAWDLSFRIITFCRSVRLWRTC